MTCNAETNKSVQKGSLEPQIVETPFHLIGHPIPTTSCYPLINGNKIGDITLDNIYYNGSSHAYSQDVNSTHDYDRTYFAYWAHNTNK